MQKARSAQPRKFAALLHATGFLAQRSKASRSQGRRLKSRNPARRARFAANMLEPHDIARPVRSGGRGLFLLWGEILAEAEAWRPIHSFRQPYLLSQSTHRGGVK
jgi:hypothetical protein